MKRIFKKLFFALLILQLGTNAHAVGVNGPCNTTDLCDAGLFCGTGTCKNCADGTYTDTAGATVCKSCTLKPSGATFTGPATSNNCPWAITCSAGQQWTGTACTSCSSGTYSASDRNITGTGSSSSAQACAACGTYSSNNTDFLGCTCEDGYHTSGQAETHTANNGTNCIPRTYTITYEPNGGSGSNQTQSVTYLSTFTTKPSTTFSRTGYTFSYWSSSYWEPSKEYTYSTKGDTISKAQWSGVPFTIKYEGNGGTGSGPSYPTSCRYGSTCNAPTNNYIRNGMAFAGWKCTGGVAGKCNGNIIQPGETLNEATTTENAEITLTAQWDNCPKGYYCSGGSKTACDAGTTTDSDGQTSKSACKIKAGSSGTKFCDGEGNCFNLPTDVSSSY